MEKVIKKFTRFGNYVLFYERGLKTVLAMLPLSDDICVLFEGLSKRWGEPTGEQEVATDIKKKHLKLKFIKLERRCYDVKYSGNTWNEDVTMCNTQAGLNQCDWLSWRLKTCCQKLSDDIHCTC